MNQDNRDTDTAVWVLDDETQEPVETTSEWQL